AGVEGWSAEPHPLTLAERVRARHARAEGMVVGRDQHVGSSARLVSECLRLPPVDRLARRELVAMDKPDRSSHEVDAQGFVVLVGVVPFGPDSGRLCDLGYLL